MGRITKMEQLPQTRRMRQKASGKESNDSEKEIFM